MCSKCAFVGACARSERRATDGARHAARHSGPRMEPTNDARQRAGHYWPTHAAGLSTCGGACVGIMCDPRWHAPHKGQRPRVYCCVKSIYWNSGSTRVRVAASSRPGSFLKQFGHFPFCIHAENTDPTQQSGTQGSTHGLNRMAHVSRQSMTSLPVPEDASLRQLR